MATLKYITDGLVTSALHNTYAAQDRGFDWRYANVGADCEFFDPDLSQEWDDAPALLRVLKAGGSATPDDLVPQVIGICNGGPANDYSDALKAIFKQRLPTINELLASYAAVPITVADTQAKLTAYSSQLQVLWAGVLPNDLQTVIVIWSMPIMLLRADQITADRELTKNDGETDAEFAARVANSRKPEQGMFWRPKLIADIPGGQVAPTPPYYAIIGSSTHCLELVTFTETGPEYDARLSAWNSSTYAIDAVAVTGRVMKIGLSRPVPISNDTDMLTLRIKVGAVGTIVPTYVSFDGHATSRLDLYEGSELPKGVYTDADDKWTATTKALDKLARQVPMGSTVSQAQLTKLQTDVAALFAGTNEDSTSAVPTPTGELRDIDRIIVARNDDQTARKNEPTNALILSPFQYLYSIKCIVPYQVIELKRTLSGSTYRSLSVAGARFILHGHVRSNASYGFQGNVFRRVKALEFEQPDTNPEADLGDVFLVAQSDVSSGDTHTFKQASQEAGDVPGSMAAQIQQGKAQSDISKGAVAQSVKSSTSGGNDSMSLVTAVRTVTGDQDTPFSGGGGESFFTAIVYGGNCPQTASPFAVLKDVIYSLQRFPKPLEPKKAVDFTKLDLPVTFAHGDAIPKRPTAPTVNPQDATWPSGLGLARLCRGTPTIDGSTWDADVYTPAPIASIDSVPYYAGFKSPSATVAYVYFDKPPIAVDYTKIKLLDNGVVQPDVILSATISNSRIAITFSLAVTIAATMAIRFEPNAVTTRTVVDDTGTSTNYKNTANIDVPINTGLFPWMTPVTSVPGVKARDVVYDPAKNTTLQIYFTGLLSTAPTATGIVLTPATLTVSGGTVNTTDRSLVEYTITAPDDTAFDAAISVDVAAAGGATFAQGDIPSGATASATGVQLHTKLARDCYIRVINRFTERDYKRGDVIQVSTTSFYMAADENDVLRKFYDSRIVEAVRNKSYIYQIVGGNELPYMATVGIKRVTSLITTIPAGYVDGTPTSTIPGVGWARSLDDDSLVLVLNDPSSMVTHDLVLNLPIWGLARKTIPDDNGGSYSVIIPSGTL